MTAETQVTILLAFAFLIFASMWGYISSYIARKNADSDANRPVLDCKWSIRWNKKALDYPTHF